jgi:hypothetical protein
MIFSFGQSEHDRIEIDVLGYECAAVGEYWDDNWLRTEIRVFVGSFRGKVGAAIMTSELSRFLSELRPLFEKLSGSAEFSTLERQLNLRLTGDRKGHVELQGEIVDQPGIGNRLRFTLAFDQTQLADAIRELDRVISEFPVRSA